MSAIVFESPIGRLILEEKDGSLTGVRPLREETFVLPSECAVPVLQEARFQLELYFKGNRRDFDLPLAPKGTDFQRRVWTELARIPYGQTVCYGDIARALGAPRAFRAVGMACGANPLMIVVPCHRVLMSGGKIGGFSGGLERKRFLLALEKSVL